jgi:predicted small lipoprotein YifL
MALLLTLSACGQTGPLYMPKPPVRKAGPALQTVPAAPAGAAIGTATSPPSPAAGVVGPSTGAGANDTQAITEPSPAEVQPPIQTPPAQQ